MSKGKRIKLLRIKKGMAQVELAQKIGVSKQTLYKYENDIITNIPSDKIELLASVLDTTPAYIMEWEEPDSDSQPFSAQFDAGIKAMTPMDEVRSVYTRNRKELSKEERMRLAAEILQDDDEDL